MTVTNVNLTLFCFVLVSTKMLIHHVKHAAVNGSKDVTIYSKDTDVVVLAVLAFVNLGLDKILNRVWSK